MASGMQNIRDLNYDNLVDFRTVLCGFTALSRAGLIIFNYTHLCVQTDKETLNDMHLGCFTIYYNPDPIDYEYEVVPSTSNPLLLQPSKERALVECIKHLDWVDEGLLVEGLYSYKEHFWSDHIYEVAEHFGVSKETMDYWFEESSDWTGA